MAPGNSLSSDLAFVRELAEAGQNAPLLGGRFLALWGGLATLAYIGHYGIISGTLGLGPSALWYLWGGFMLLGVGGQKLMGAGMPAKPGVSSAGNQVQATLYMVSGIMMFTYFAGVIARVLITGAGYEGFIWSVPMVLGLYGIGQIVTGTITRQRSLLFAGVVAFIGVAAASFLTGSDLIWLVGAGVAFLAIFLPGVMLLKAEPATTV